MSKKKRRGRSRSRRLSNREIRNTYISKLAALDLENPRIFSGLVINFFKDVFKIKYEVTLEELIEITLRKKLAPELQGEITKLLSGISELEFKTQAANFDTSYFKFSFEKILNVLTSEKEADSMLKPKKRFPVWLSNCISLILSFLKKLAESKKKKISDISEQIELCNQHIFEKDPESAKKSYLEALNTYNKLSDDEKESHYDSLKELREKLIDK